VNTLGLGGERSTAIIDEGTDKPWYEFELWKAVRVRFISLTIGEQLGLGRSHDSELRVGNLTSPSGDTNPSCEVRVDEGGFYNCNLWGDRVTMRRRSPPSK